MTPFQQQFNYRSGTCFAGPTADRYKSIVKENIKWSQHWAATYFLSVMWQILTSAGIDYSVIEYKLQGTVPGPCSCLLGWHQKQQTLQKEEWLSYTCWQQKLSCNLLMKMFDCQHWTTKATRSSWTLVLYQTATPTFIAFHHNIQKQEFIYSQWNH